MENILVKRAEFLHGRIPAPPSKSYTHRAIIIGSIDRSSRIRNPLFCDDTERSIDACRNLGASMKIKKDLIIIDGWNQNPKKPEVELNFGESASSLRFMIPLCGLVNGEVTLTGEGSLKKRPNDYLVRNLRKLGMEISGKGKFHTVPIRIRGKGKLHGGKILLEGDIYSSQFISALLLAFPLAGEDTLIRIRGKLVSKPYIDITIDVLQKAGVKVVNREYREFEIPGAQKFRGLDYPVSGDYSSSAFILAAGCILDSDVEITELEDDRQGDRKIVDFLREMGADVKRSGKKIIVRGPYELDGGEFDCCDTPDLVPVLAILASSARGKTRIFNISHLRIKESDRIGSLAEELSKLGVKVKPGPDYLIIDGSATKLRGGIVDSHGDHRIAMALSVLGLKTEGICIKGGESISKSYPDFINDLKSLGADIKMEERKWRA
jgi:3-phosphoshikimate 1-carboxyvinyltransferase